MDYGQPIQIHDRMVKRRGRVMKLQMKSSPKEYITSLFYLNIFLFGTAMEGVNRKSFVNV